MMIEWLSAKKDTQKNPLMNVRINCFQVVVFNVCYKLRRNLVTVDK